jgi:hypothetical protein
MQPEYTAPEFETFWRVGCDRKTISPFSRLPLFLSQFLIDENTMQNLNNGETNF